MADELFSHIFLKKIIAEAVHIDHGPLGLGREPAHDSTANIAAIVAPLIHKGIFKFFAENIRLPCHSVHSAKLNKKCDTEVLLPAVKGKKKLPDSEVRQPRLCKIFNISLWWPYRRG